VVSKLRSFGHLHGWPQDDKQKMEAGIPPADVALMAEVDKGKNRRHFLRQLGSDNWAQAIGQWQLILAIGSGNRVRILRFAVDGF
jgi:hypothetical protein